MKNFVLVILLVICFTIPVIAKEYRYDPNTMKVYDIEESVSSEKTVSDELVEISCETVRRVSRINQLLETYATLGFYIDDKNKQLYFAPNKTRCISASRVFNDNEISLYGLSYADAHGSLHINRNSGTINMQLTENRDVNVVINYTGRCSKVEKNKKF